MNELSPTITAEFHTVWGHPLVTVKFKSLKRERALQGTLTWSLSTTLISILHDRCLLLVNSLPETSHWDICIQVSRSQISCFFKPIFHKSMWQVPMCYKNRFLLRKHLQIILFYPIRQTNLSTSLNKCLENLKLESNWWQMLKQRWMHWGIIYNGFHWKKVSSKMNMQKSMI